MLIYKVTNIVNNKVYIGQTIKTLIHRKKQHHSLSLSKQIKTKSYFIRAIDKYGINKFKWEIIKVCNNINELNKWEKYYIKKFNSFGKGGYNLTNGGLNYIVSEETKKKTRDAATERMDSYLNCGLYGNDFIYVNEDGTITIKHKGEIL